MKILLLVRMSFANVSSSSSLGNCPRQIKCIRDEATLTLSLMYRTHTPTSYLVAQHRERERESLPFPEANFVAPTIRKKERRKVCVSKS